MLKVLSTSEAVAKKAKKQKQTKLKKEKLRVDLGNVSEALEQENDNVIIAFFNQGYAPEKAPGFIGMVLGVEGLEKLNEKYELWKMGLLNKK